MYEISRSIAAVIGLLLLFLLLVASVIYIFTAKDDESYLHKTYGILPEDWEGPKNIDQN